MQRLLNYLTVNTDMLPYSIRLIKEGEMNEIAPVYTELPVRFTITGADKGGIKLLAIDPGDQSKPVYDLTEELFSNEDGRILENFLLRSPYWQCVIDKTNILRISTTGVRGCIRSFNLPWQAGIEPSIFEKHLKQWRRNQGLNNYL